MADEQNSSSSDNDMEIMGDPPSIISGAQAGGTGTIQDSNSMDTSDYDVGNVIAKHKDSSREETAPANVEHVSAAGENTLEAEGEPATSKWLINPSLMEVVEVELSKANDSNSSEPSKDEPWLEVSQQRLLQIQQTVAYMPPLHRQLPPLLQQPPALLQQPPALLQQPPQLPQQPPPMLHQTPPLLHQTPPLLHQRPPLLHQTPPLLHQRPPLLHQRPPLLHQTPPLLHQTPPLPHQRPPLLHQTPSMLHETPSMLHQTPSMLHQTPSRLHQTLSRLHQTTLQLYQTLPLHHQMPPIRHQTSQLLNQPPSRAPIDSVVRAGPSWADDSALDYMMSNRRSEGTRGRHDQALTNVSTANKLAPLTRRRGPTHGKSNEYQRTSRVTPYVARYRDTTGMAGLRSSRSVRQSGVRDVFESQHPHLAYPAHHNILQYPAAEGDQFQTLRNILNFGITPESSPQKCTPQPASQYIHQSSPMVYTPSSPPKLVHMSAPRNTPRSSPQRTPFSSPRYTPHSPGAAPAELFDVPSTSHEPQQPLDLSLLSRELSTFIPISQSSSSRSAVRVTSRTCPVTSTVTSAVNTEVFNPFDLLPRLPLNTEKSSKSPNRIQLYSNCSEHLLQKQTSHRAKTPTDILPEHQIYKTWPVDNWAHTDHVEEVETPDYDSWLEYIGTLDTPAATTRPRPSIIVEPPKPSTSSSAMTSSASPPRTTSSPAITSSASPPRTTSS